mgnify:CR=1 FL=1
MEYRNKQVFVSVYNLSQRYPYLGTNRVYNRLLRKNDYFIINYLRIFVSFLLRIIFEFQIRWHLDRRIDVWAPL